MLELFPRALTLYKKTTTNNCHFIIAGSDDRVPRRPTLMQPCFDQTPESLRPLYSIEFRRGLKKQNSNQMEDQIK